MNLKNLIWCVLDILICKHLNTLVLHFLLTTFLIAVVISIDMVCKVSQMYVYTSLVYVCVCVWGGGVLCLCVIAV